MSYQQPAPPDKDPQLWEIAQRRASFKSHFAYYLVINGFLWAIWTFAGGRSEHYGGLPWPIWPTLGWGIGLLFHFMGAYVYPQSNSVEREYEKLSRNKK